MTPDEATAERAAITKAYRAINRTLEALSPDQRERTLSMIDALLGRHEWGRMKEPRE
jgi:hypothetical protein